MRRSGAGSLVQTPNWKAGTLRSPRARADFGRHRTPDVAMIARAELAGSVGQTGRGAVTYVASSLAQRGIPLLMLPLLLGALSPDEYGRIMVITSVAAVLAVLTPLGLETAVFRGYLRLAGRPADQARLVNTLGMVIVVVPVAAAALCSIAVLGLGDLGSQTEVAVVFGLVAGGLQATSTALPLALLRAQQRFRAYATTSVAFAIAYVAAMAALVLALRGGGPGWMIAMTVSWAVVLTLGLWLVGHRWTMSFSRPQLAVGLALGVPLIPHALAQWGLNLSDRLILGALGSPVDVGVYSAAYQLALPIALIALAINQASAHTYIRVEQDRD